MRKLLLKKKWLFLISFLVIITDQASKAIATAFLSHNTTRIIIPNLIGFRLIRNTGAAFSLFTQSTEFLTLLSLLVCRLLLVVAKV